MANQISSTILKIVEQVHTIIDEIAFVYLKEHGPIYNWSSICKAIFELNCDTEVISFLKKNNILLCNASLDCGVTFGLLIIKKEIEEFYVSQYGTNLDLHTKTKMFNKINIASYNFIVTGFEDKNGN